MNRTFGRHIASDQRDREFRLTFGEQPAVKKRFWRDTFFNGNQLDTPTCVGFGCAHYLANEPLTQYLPPHGIYTLAQYLDEWEGQDYEGTSVRAGVKVLQKLGFIASYHWATTAADLAKAIVEIGPAILGVEWFSGMNDVDSSGFIRVKGRSLGGHCLLANGVDISKGYFRLKQSWGLDWGVRGRCSISFDDIDKLLANGGEACIPRESSPSIHNPFPSD